MFKTFNKSQCYSAHVVNVFMLGLGDGEGAKPNPKMHIVILGRSLNAEEP
jgi:hypothetical protein